MFFNKQSVFSVHYSGSHSLWQVICLCIFLSACATQQPTEPPPPDPEQIQQAIQAEADQKLFQQALDLSASREASESDLITAMRIFEQLYASNPKYLGALANAADMAFRLQQYPKAEQLYQSLLKQFSDHEPPNDSDTATAENAQQNPESDQSPEQKQPMSDVADKSDAPSEEQKQRFQVHSLNQLGLLAREQGKFEQAEQYYRQALAIQPDQPQVLRNLAILLDLYRGKLAEALSLYQRYQGLLEEEDAQVKDWIFDLKNRLPEEVVNE